MHVASVSFFVHGRKLRTPDPQVTYLAAPERTNTVKLIAVQIHVSGKVQGVFFRENIRRMAERSHLTGSVRNLPDGRVAIRAQGKEEHVKQLIEWCHQGPPLARVDGVMVEFVEPSHADGFIITRE